jgi:hypothetical protein
MRSSFLQPKTMALFAGLVVMLTVALMLLLKDVVYQVVVVPVFYAYWLAGLAIASLHQGVLWVVLVLAVAILLLRGLRPHQQQRPASARHHPRPGATSQGRVAFWEAHVARVAAQGYSGETSRHELRKLMLSVLAYQRHTTPAQIEAYLQGEGLQVPPEMAPYLEIHPPEIAQASSSSRFKRWLSALLGVHTDPTDVPHRQNLERAIQFVECQLEIAHDHQGK